MRWRPVEEDPPFLSGHYWLRNVDGGTDEIALVDSIHAGIVFVTFVGDPYSVDWSFIAEHYSHCAGPIKRPRG